MTTSPGSKHVPLANRTMDQDSDEAMARASPKYSSLSSYKLSWTQRAREWRHSPCIMGPTTSLLIIAIALLSLIGLVFQLPTFVLGLFLSPLMRRMPWFVEFIYPSAVARFVHISLMQWGLSSKVGRGSGVKGKNGKLMPPQHSRSAEQRTEVVPGRIYIHPLPQLLDNIGYLIVCCPPPSDDKVSNILGILVDCGDAKSALAQVDLIKETHYSDLPNKAKIEIHAVLSTHKHHDHTAGNRGLLADKVTSKTLKMIVGGAVENVPYCTHPVKNGQRIPLPKVGRNDMSEMIEIECISVPSHTRGSTVYALRTLVPHGEIGLVSHIFTGDAMFSGGGGVAFESDIEFSKDKNMARKKRKDPVKVTAGKYSIERCFAEVLVRSAAQVKDDALFRSSHPRQVLMFPGHEYTSDLLLRQLDPSNEHHGHWTKLPPVIFFETAAQYLISQHRRALPKSSRLMTVPSSLGRELKTNPHFRALKKRGEHLITAVRVWYRYVSRTKREEYQSRDLAAEKDSLFATQESQWIPHSSNGERKLSAWSKTPSTEMSWTLDANDINRSVFTTVYASDLNSIIKDLKSGNIDGKTAAARLQDMPKKLEEPVVTRRPIPGTLPSEKNMYLAAVALALLGSPPSGMTVRDGISMDLPLPVDSSDMIVISRARIVSILALTGLLDTPITQSKSNVADNKEEEEPCIVEMLEILWREAQADSNTEDLTLSEEKQPRNQNDIEVPNESSGEDEDGIELGLLKMTLNGAAMNQPSWFTKFCLPCGTKGSDLPARLVHPSVAIMRRSGGELVRHDVHICPMCCDVVGCPTNNYLEEIPCEEQEDGGDDDESDGDFDTIIHQSPLMEGTGDGSSTGDEDRGVELQVMSKSV